MKRRCLLPVLLVTTLLIHCSKDKKDKPAEPYNGPLAVYTMNDELKDSTGNIPKTEYSKGIKAVADRKGNPKGAMYFDAGNMWANVNDWAADSITITCWVKSDGLPGGKYFLSSDTGAFGLYDLNGTMGLAISLPATNSALANFGPGWIHFAGTYDGINIRGYINGQLMKVKNHPGHPGHSQQITVGAMNGWTGAIDDLRFYNRTLSENEIAVLASN